MSLITIQPKELPGGTLPYPYFIDKKGMVGRQDFWKGKPKKLVGFSIKPKTGDINFDLKDFLRKPKAAIGMYPVFENKDGNWVTKTISIESIKRN